MYVRFYFKPGVCLNYAFVLHQTLMIMVKTIAVFMLTFSK